MDQNRMNQYRDVLTGLRALMWDGQEESADDIHQAWSSILSAMAAEGLGTCPYCWVNVSQRFKPCSQCKEEA